MASLPPLEKTDFAAFVHAVHDHDPFPWQEDLLDRALADQWPDAIRVPTGLGKTSVVDVAVFALAAQAHLEPTERTARTRTFVVIDRRVVVDDVTVHAERLRDALESPPTPEVGIVANRLRYIGSRPGSLDDPLAQPRSPLAVTRMRGGVTWEARWISRPEQPAVVVGTVDQLASRLLFRGYGVTPSSLPIDAALVGSDSLILLDEAHLAQPLLETLSELIAWEAQVPEPVLPRRPPRLVAMSATVPALGGSDGPADVLDISDRDLAHPEAGKRLRARKRTMLWELVARSELPAVLAAAARRLADDPTVSTVGIVCNTVPVARSVHAALKAAGAWAELLIGPCREIDRELVMERVRGAAGIDRSRFLGERDPCFVVATQTIEVGVNLDFDALASEAAPLDALAQRFGRLDRLGSRTEQGFESRAVIVYCGPLHEDDPVYGSPLARTWQHLCSHAQPQPVPNARAAAKVTLEGDLDLGPLAFAELRKAANAEWLVSEAPTRPVVFPQTHLSEWARTSPQPVAGSDIVPFVRGHQEHRPTVLLVWRADVPATDDRGYQHLERQGDASLVRRPLCPQEQVEVPLSHVRRWLRREPAAAQPEPLADVPVTARAPAEESYADERPIAALRMTSEGCEALKTANDVRPGDLLLLPSSARGLDEFGWHPEGGSAVVDVADLCETRAGRVVRLVPETLKPVSAACAEAVETFTGELDPASPLTKKDAERVAQAMLDALQDETDSGEPPAYRRLLRKTLGEMLNRESGWDLSLVMRWTSDEDSEPTYVLLAKRQKGKGESELRADEEETSSLGSGGPVSLDEHRRAVTARARVSAERLGIAPDLVRAITLAAELHDLGKADPRFQRMLRGGEELAYMPGDPLLAKSGIDPGDRAAWRRAQRLAGWPGGLRHEALSLAIAERLFAAGYESDLIDDHRDLVLQLVSSHHGYGRPLFPVPRVRNCVGISVSHGGVGVTVEASAIESAIPNWDGVGRLVRLIERHGAWGLALLESVLRLADMACSEAGT